MHACRILVVDDESTLRLSLSRFLDRRGYQIVTASTRVEAERLAQAENSLQLCLIDLQLPDGSGLDLMTSLQKIHPKAQFVILTGFGTIESAVEATKRGAYQFITKPFNLEEIGILVDRALNNSHLVEENRQLKSQLHRKYQFENIIGTSHEMTQVMDMIERVSDCDSTVLISGESGTGKELVAQAIHYNSPRAEKVLIPVNCGAIPSDLLESELFGHIKGAFTGATANRIGRFELANQGTIFLDEIGEMSPALQVKLLRAIQERKFEPVGSARTVEVDVRIIAATNRNLERMIEEGTFREDLYYRLNVIPITIPSLRERRTDIPLLLHHFMKSFNDSKRKALEGFTPDVLDQLSNYTWPGNVRELENLIERLAILKGKGIIQSHDLPEKYQSRNAAPQVVSESALAIPDAGIDFNSVVDSYENALIMKALEKTGWNRNQAAQLLRLNRTTLVEKIKKKGLVPPPNMGDAMRDL